MFDGLDLNMQLQLNISPDAGGDITCIWVLD